MFLEFSGWDNKRRPLGYGVCDKFEIKHVYKVFQRGKVMKLLDSLGISDGLAEKVRLSITVKKHLRISSL